jgi:hypothetical protein
MTGRGDCARWRYITVLGLPWLRPERKVEKDMDYLAVVRMGEAFPD